MESSLLLFRPKASEDVKTNRLQQVLDYALQGISYDTIEFADQLSPLNNRKILFAIDLGNVGINFEYYHALSAPNIHTLNSPIEMQPQATINEDIVICYGMMET